MAIVPYQLYCPIDCQVNGGNTGIGIEWPSRWSVYLTGVVIEWTSRWSVYLYT